MSVGMWYVIALAYQEVTHSYGVDALEIPVSQLLILMGSSMAGIDAAIAGSRRRLADGDHRYTLQRIRCASGTGGELRNSAVAGDVCGSGPGWAFAGPS